MVGWIRGLATRYCAAHDCSAEELASTLSLDLSLDLDTSVDLATFVADVDPGALASRSTGDATMAAIEAAASARPGQSAAAARCRQRAPLGQWKPCATGGECYKNKMECDGGDPDCADGTDESPRVCNTTTTTTTAATATAAAAATTPATPAPDTSSGGTGMTTTIAYAGAALLIVGALVAAWRHNSGKAARENDGEQVQGMSMSFANPGFQAPRPAATEDDGELYEDGAAPADDGELYEDGAAPQQPHYEEAGPGQPGAQPSYSEVGDGKVAAAPRLTAVVNATYAGFVAGGGGVDKVAPGMCDSDFADAAQPPKAGGAPGGEGIYDQDHPDADKYAAPGALNTGANYDLGPGNYDLGPGNYDLGPANTNTDGNALKTRYDYDSMSEEEI